MSIRTVITTDGSGTPLNLVIVSREAVNLECAALTLDSLNDDGASITAVVILPGGLKKLLVLFTGSYYQHLSLFEDAEIDERIVEVLSTFT